MTPTTCSRSAIAVRRATPADNRALVALAAACPMRGSVSLCVDRAPEFFALNRLEGDSWRVGVAVTDRGDIVGCIAVAARRAYICGRPTQVTCASDFKVHPAFRGGPAADALVAYARDECRRLGGQDVPIWLTILAGNSAMERRISGPRDTPVLQRVATIRSHSVSLLWRRRITESGLRICSAATHDLHEMAELWARLAPRRQLAAVHDGDQLTSWIDSAPGLEPGAYFLAWRRDGRLAGFLGMWDQARFKQLRVMSYSPRLAAFRVGFNAIAPIIGATSLPRTGAPLRHLTAVHVCVAPDEPHVLRALLLAAYSALRGHGYSFFSIGLDTRDPLTAALGGLLAQPTDIDVYVTTPSGRYSGPSFGASPFHFEIALA